MRDRVDRALDTGIRDFKASLGEGGVEDQCVSNDSHCHPSSLALLVVELTKDLSYLCAPWSTVRIAKGEVLGSLSDTAFELVCESVNSRGRGCSSVDKHGKVSNITL